MRSVRQSSADMTATIDPSATANPAGSVPAHKSDEPMGQLPPQPWMLAPETKTVIAALTAQGADVRFVGGCVRDAVLQRPINDIDIATHEPPERVMELLELAGIRAIPTGIAHGTVTAVVGKAHFEITTLRSDVESFGRHARVEFTDDWTEDAARRDFTINAMFCRPDGAIFDPFDGLSDLGAGRVRFVGDPMQRIDEDVLRLLRFFRFQAHYGRPPADPRALAACRAQAHKLPTLSGERVCGELFKLLQAPDPAGAVLLMQGHRVLDVLLPEALNINRLRMLAFLENRGVVHGGVRPDSLRRLAAVLTVDKAGADAVAERLRLSNAQKIRLAQLAAPEHRPDAAMGEQAARRMLHHLGREQFCDLVLLAWAGRRALENRPSAAESDGWRALLALAEQWVPVDFPIKGQDLKDLGVPHGPAIGSLLKELEQWWEDGDYRADRAAVLAEAQRRLTRSLG